MKPINKDGPVLRALLGITNGLCKTLHVPCPPVTYVTLEVESPDGATVQVLREKSNSWVRNAHNMICGMFLGTPAITTGTYGDGVLRCKDTAGTTRNVIEGGDNPSILASSIGIGADARGIVIGTGTAAESLSDTTLQSKIAHGTGAGQMSYQAHVAGVPSFNSGTKKWTNTHTRIFNNNTASTITVTEVGMIGWANNASFNALIDRSLLGTAVSVPAAYKLTVTYTMEYTFPA